ncbi:hypothetical protein PLESTB_000173500 [Pleodorina starrii]|uniref:DNA replication licensing factor MCM3 n=1 Tax=Pleodorina starrii TaxID=330485 RepID=A0A9W6EXK0_9CHLO|nr:hypothetical protein PLESTM_000523300 [Pleodorina starrii]GLC49018.1 hypothetical protein PLESTB_000173500 [Pleodorina starrii]GLC66187.1 hypothetical protein PLESTF_000394400 [Pleodorina starrii]
MEDYSEVRVQLTRRFADFFEYDFQTPGQGSWSYARALEDLYEPVEGDGKAYRIKSRRLMVAEHHLRKYDEPLLLQLLQKPLECLPAFEDALSNFVKSGVDPVLLRLLEETGNPNLYIGLKGDFGRHEVSPRQLTSAFLNQLVCVFGIVTKCSLVRPKLVTSVHYSEATKEYTTQQYRDVTSLRGAPTNTAYPQFDNAGNPLTTEFGLCKYIDNQMMQVQELPETAPPGQLPHSTEIVLEGDLVDGAKPGDRVMIVGIYKPLAGKQAGAVNAVYKAVLVGVSVHKLNKDSQTKVTMADAREIKRLAQRPRVLDLLGASLAPSIFGHDIIKKGLALMLFGGLEKTLENGTHLRGDINALMVGDPGVAKSQLLRAVMNIAPHAVSTTGRGSSGVGLTAAVTTDGETGEKRLEAGAMVLADRGVVCIDEFDKMSDQDRVAIHEVMEQQTVTIAKAGIHTSLNARCSVLAAANPLYGSYDRNISVTRNVNLPDSLLSRFDMLFVVLDSMNDERDRQVALHVLRQHQYRPPGDDGRGATLQETIHDRRLSMDQDPDDIKMWLKIDTRLHGAAAESEQQVLTTEFLRKYLIFAKRKYARAAAQAAAKGGPGGAPSLAIEEGAVKRIVDYYVSLRGLPPTQRNFPVTPRCLETIIRLATAHCKVRLGDVISRTDVAVACALLDHVMRREIVGEADHARKADHGGNGGEEDGGDEDGGAPAPRRQGREEAEEDEEMDDAAGAGAAAAAAQGTGAYGVTAAEPAAGTRTRRTAKRTRADDDADAAAEPSGQADAPARRRAARNGGAAAGGVSGDVVNTLAAAGVRTVPDGHEEAMVAADNAASGSEAFPTLESLTSEAKAAIVSEIGAMLEERGRDELVEIAELKRILASKGLSVSMPALAGYVKWISHNHDLELAKGNYLPDVAYDEDSNMFSFM